MSQDKPRVFWKGIKLRPEASDPTNTAGHVWVNTTDGLKLNDNGTVRTVLTNDKTQTVTNKTVNIEDNTINSANTEKALVTDNTGRLVTSTVTKTELETLTGVTGSIQDQLDNATSDLHSVMVGLTAGAKYAWSGTELSITDGNVTPLSTDSIAKLRIIGKSQVLNLKRQDGQDSTTTISIADGECLFIQIPSTGNVDYSGVGVGSTNYQIVAANSYVINNENYWIAVREGSKLYVRGVGELMSGESAEITDPISQEVLTFIGATSEADSDPNYTSTTVVTQGGSLVQSTSELDARSSVQTNLIRQNASAKLVKGGIISFNSTSGELILSQNAYLSIPGLANDVNEITAQTIVLDADNKVASIEIKRTAGASTRSVSVNLINLLTVTDNTKIIARRVGNDVIVADSFLLKDGEMLELDGALAEINRYFGQLRLKEHESTIHKVRVTPSDVNLLDGSILSQIMSSTLLDFEGAVINFSNGQVLKADDVTALGDNFTPYSVPAGQYYWYGVSVVQNTLNADNTQVGKLLVEGASSSNVVQASAPKPTITGEVKIGAVQVFNNGGNIEVVQIVKLGVGSGSGSGSGGSGLVKVDLMDPISTILPSGVSVTIDGISGVNGDVVLFTNLSSGNNRIYELSGVGTSIVWTAVASFSNSLDPVDGDLVIVQRGEAFADQIAKFDGTDFTVNDTIRLFDGVSANYLELGSIKSATLLNNTTANLMSVAVSGSENFIFDYSILRGSDKETGQLLITSNGTDARITRTNSYIGDVGVVFNVSISLGNLILAYTTTNTGSPASMKFSTKRWSDSLGGPGGVPSYSGGGSGGAAGGANTEIQFNNAGILDGDANFKWESSDPAINLNSLRISALSSSITLNDNQVSPATCLSYVAADYPFAIIEYSVSRSTDRRVGRFLIPNNGTVVQFNDDMVETGATGISFTASISGANVLVQYTSTSTGNIGSMKLSMRKWN